jgi:CheY-like chemotaxis protein
VNEAPLVLVVDDQVDAADELAQLLQMVGYRTVVAYDGDSGVDAALQQRPAVAIFDLHMPRMGGLVACTRIRDKLPRGDILLVALTGSTQARDREAAELAGFDHYLIKPVMLNALLQVLPRLPSA